MIKGFMIAGLGSFIGGGLRFVITNYSKHPNYFLYPSTFPSAWSVNGGSLFRLFGHSFYP